MRLRMGPPHSVCLYEKGCQCYAPNNQVFAGQLTNSVVIKLTFGGRTISTAGGVFRAEKHTGANQVTMVDGLARRPMDIHVYAESRQAECEKPLLFSLDSCGADS